MEPGFGGGGVGGAMGKCCVPCICIYVCDSLVLLMIMTRRTNDNDGAANGCLCWLSTIFVFLVVIPK